MASKGTTYDHQLRAFASNDAGRFVYVAQVSMFDIGDWEELDVGIVGEGLSDFIVTDPSMATHRRYRNRVTGEIITTLIR